MGAPLWSRSEEDSEMDEFSVLEEDSEKDELSGSEEDIEEDELSGSEEDELSGSEEDERDRAEAVKEIIYDDFHVYRGIHYTMATDRYPPRRVLVPLYAKLGLHRYNFLKGKDLQLRSVQELIKSTVAAASTYCITFQALDPETSSGLLETITFKARVSELKYGRFILMCSVARPLGETKENTTDGEINTRCVLNNQYLGHFMPELPSEDPFKDDTCRFHVLNKSEVHDNEWIRLYLELAVATSFRSYIAHGMTSLKILEVAMEITRNLEPFKMGLDAYDAIFYIRYKDFCKARVGKDVNRVAIVRRIVDVHSEVFRIVGHTLSSKTIKPSNAMEAGSSMMVD